MAISKTFQSNIKTHNMNTLTDYALFLGGLNVTRDSLEQYDPLKTGFGRVFMIRTPKFFDSPHISDEIRAKLKKFKHVLEYANTGVSGLNNITVQFNNIQGGYTGKQFEIPSIATDDTNEFTIKTYEFSGSLMREITQFWINGVTDINSGLSHYYYSTAEYQDASRLAISQANHTAEFIYVATDQSGVNVEYACLLANCFPKEIKLDHFNYDAGTHDLVPLDIAFTCSRYHSPQINQKAKQLLNKYNILMNSLNFNSGYTGPADTGSYYDLATGQLVKKDGTKNAHGVFRSAVNENNVISQADYNGAFDA